MNKEYTFEQTLEGYNVIRLDMDALAKRGIHWGDTVQVIVIKKDQKDSHQ